jgi:hypothetical protein
MRCPALTGRHNIEVAIEDEMRSRLPAPEAHNDIRPPRRDLGHLDRPPEIGEVVRQELGSELLVAWRILRRN